MKLSIFTLLFLATNIIGITQVPKQVIVEHFTNTLCGICGNSNPNLNANLANQSEILRISFHPSSPYNGCTFNQHNIIGNDARTNQYGIYGGTPRIVIQGEVQPPGGGNFSNPALFDNYTGESSPVSILVAIDTLDMDSINVSITITVEDNIDMTHQNPSLYVGLAEDTILFNAPNGETKHINVFRKELNGNTGNNITLQDVVGQQLTLTYTIERSADWNIERLFAFAMLQDPSTNEILQSGASNFETNQTLQINQSKENQFTYHINQNHLNIQFELSESFNQILIFNFQGEIVKQKHFNSNSLTLDLNQLKPSLYIVRLYNTKLDTTDTFKIMKGN